MRRWNVFAHQNVRIWTITQTAPKSPGSIQISFRHWLSRGTNGDFTLKLNWGGRAKGTRCFKNLSWFIKKSPPPETRGGNRINLCSQCMCVFDTAEWFSSCLWGVISSGVACRCSTGLSGPETQLVVSSEPPRLYAARERHAVDLFVLSLRGHSQIISLSDCTLCVSYSPVMFGSGFFCFFCFVYRFFPCFF